MKSYGLKYVFCTLHIGLGTFNPIRCSNINDHKLHEELFNIPRKTIEEIESCRNRGGKVIAVGTTVLRALESFLAKAIIQQINFIVQIFILSLVIILKL